MTPTLISIIIPVYNVEQYLRQCLDSILNQSYENYEVLMVDDGSTDKCPAICDEYAGAIYDCNENENFLRLSKSGDPRIKVFHKENGGVSSARNLGIEYAKGDWIWFVDADDFIAKDALQIQKDTITKFDTDIIYFGLESVLDGVTPSQIPNSHHNLINIDKNSFLKNVVCNTHQAILYKKSIIEEQSILFPIGMKMSEDLEFQYKFLLHCNKITQIYSTLYYLRIREGSASHNPNTLRNSLHGNQMILKHMLDYIKQQDDKGLHWMGIRMVNRVKNLMKAAGKIPEVKHDEIQKEVRYYIAEFRNIGYREFNCITMKLAYIDIRLYLVLFHLRLLKNRFMSKL